MHELNPPIFTPTHATKSRGLFNGFHQLHSFSKVPFFPPAALASSFPISIFLGLPLTPPSFSSSLPSFFLLGLSLPLTIFPCAFSAQIFPLSSSISLCITLSQPNGITGEHVSLSGSALDDILTYRCEVNEMEYRSDPLSSPSLPLPYLRYLHLFAHPIPFSLSKHLYYSLAVPSAPTLSLISRGFEKQLKDYFTPLSPVFDS